MKRYLSYQQNISSFFSSVISSIDIPRGAIVNVSSDLLPLLCVYREHKEIFNPHHFIDSLIEKVGDEGTVLFPTFFWGFCRGGAFHYRETPSQTGGLGNVALKRMDFRRTRHPIYSFAVWGKHQQALCELDNVSAFGDDSPFDYLYEHRAKNLFVCIDYKKASAYVHYAEEKVGVDYRYFKDFTAPYCGESGVTRLATYRMYVRDWNVVTVISPKLDRLLIREKYYQKYHFDKVSFGVIDLRGTVDLMKEAIRSKSGLVFPQPVVSEVPSTTTSSSVLNR